MRYAVVAAGLVLVLVTNVGAQAVVSITGDVQRPGEYRHVIGMIAGDAI